MRKKEDVRMCTTTYIFFFLGFILFWHLSDKSTKILQLFYTNGIFFIHVDLRSISPEQNERIKNEWNLTILSYFTLSTFFLHCNNKGFHTNYSSYDVAREAYQRWNLSYFFVLCVIFEQLWRLYKHKNIFSYLLGNQTENLFFFWFKFTFGTTISH